MMKTLYQKLVAVLACCVIVMFVIFFLVMNRLDMARSQELNQKLYRALASELVKDQFVPEKNELDASGLQRVFERLRKINPRIDVYLLDTEGNVITGSGKAEMKRGRVNLAPINRFLDDANALPILGDDPTDPSRQRVFSAARITLSDDRSGYLYIVLRGLISDSMSERIRSSYVLQKNLWTVGVGLAFILLASAIIIRLITRPLQRLNNVMEKFRQSGFAVHPEQAAARVTSDHDVDRLTDTFNHMADRLLEQMRALKETDSKRRELVVNISHDLRTPLASLQGHLETLQSRNDRLSEAEKRHYLEIALRQARQLGRLVSRLFELAKLDSDDMKILSEPFVLDELVHDVVQQFQLDASKKGLLIAVEAQCELPLVSADIGLIERVLKNLIENSMRYTARGGEIRVVLRAAENEAVIEVLDNGSGISAEDLPRIFDRFYQAEKSRRDAPGNAGLGLAIAQRILELHGSRITATSRPGRTVMSFSLPYAAIHSPLGDSISAEVPPPEPVSIALYAKS
jgi:two-component system, OmpR family, sensor kinase